MAESTVWASELEVPSSNAALVNGTMVHGFELDDLHKEAIVHCGSVVIPPALAVAERAKVIDGRELLAAIVCGYEVAIRVGACMGVPHLLRGYHPTGTCGVFGAAAAAGKMITLNEDEMINCLGIAGSFAAGLMAAQRGAMVKRMHAGRAAQAGVTAALLASNGFTGITDVLEAEYGGFCGTLSDKCDKSKLTDGLFKNYRIREVGFKPYSCGASNHTTIDALTHLINTHSISSKDVEKIIIKTTTATRTHVGWQYEPSGTIGAQMNLPYVAAVSALEGEAFVDQFTDEKIRDPKIIEFTKKVEVTVDPELDKLGSEFRHSVNVNIILRDGRSYTHSVHHAKGSPQNPMTEKEVSDKFRDLARRVVSESVVERIFETVHTLESVKAAQDLTALLKVKNA